MIKKLYTHYIGKHLFLKISLGIAFALLIIFLLLGFLTYNSFYDLLEQREMEVLEFRTEKVARLFEDKLEQFKRETISLYIKNTQSRGSYEFFLQANIPIIDDQTAIFQERQYFSSLLSAMQSRNPNASLFFMYRNVDESLFFNRRSEFAVNTRFNFPGFFADLPRDYAYPYIGRLDPMMRSSAREVVYLINPIFEFNRIRSNQPFGYYVMGMDAAILFDVFHTNMKEEGLRLIVHLQGEPFIDSEREGNEPDLNNMLIQTYSLPKYDLVFTGLRSKQAIEAKLNQMTLFVVIILGLAWMTCILIVSAISHTVIKRLKMLTQQFKKIQTNPFSDQLPNKGEDEISDLIEKFNQMTEQLQDHIQKVYVADLQKRNAEYFALKMQINPHFLYNTLESLRMQAVIHGQPLLGEKMFTLGKLFRWMLKNTNDVVPIEEELRYTQDFLDLYTLGKSNKITFEIETHLDLYHQEILKFSLQPIIENAMKHGNLDNVKQPEIRLYIYDKDEYLCLEIKNNGIGIFPDTVNELNDHLHSTNNFKNEHLGLKNVHERIRSYYGDQYGLTVLPQRKEEGFSVLMTLPIRHNKGEKLSNE